MTPILQNHAIPGQTVSTEDELLRAAAFRSELRHFARRTEKVTAEAGLTPQRYELLLMIRAMQGARGGVRMSQLCDLLHLKQTAVTELVKRTERSGLIRRHTSPDDGRAYLLEVTPDGEARLMNAFAALRDDRETLAKSLNELDARLHTD